MLEIVSTYILIHEHIENKQKYTGNIELLKHIYVVKEGCIYTYYSIQNII